MTAVISHLSVKKSDEEEKMTETGRNYLSGSLFLSGVRDGNAAEKYTIRSVIGEGGSSVCYEAIRTKDNVTETGKLKEFYPVDAVIGKKRMVLFTGATFQWTAGSMCRNNPQI